MRDTNYSQVLQAETNIDVANRLEKMSEKIFDMRLNESIDSYEQDGLEEIEIILDNLRQRRINKAKMNLKP